MAKAATKPAARQPDRATRAAPAPQRAQPQEEAEVVGDDTGTELIETGPRTPAPAYLKTKMKEHAGKGLSKAQEDNLVPLVVLLQSGTPQVKTANPAYIEGAEAGMIWLRNYAEPFWDGKDGIYVQPCLYSKCVLEWVPRNKGGGGGSGFVARLPHRAEHPNGMPVGAKLVADSENPRRKKWINPDNLNEYQEVREHVCILHIGNQRVPYVIPMSGSNHTVSKGWMMMMNGKVLEGESEAPPSYAGLYLLTSQYKQANGFDWYMWKVADAGWVSAEDFEAGARLYDAFDKGEKKVEGYDEVGNADNTIDGTDGDIQGENPLVS